MKYELPDDLKRYKFFCNDAFTGVNYNMCKRHCHSDFRHCWEQHLRHDLELDCQVDNERKAERYVKCSACGEPCLSVAFNKYMCPDCGSVEYYDAEEQKALMGDAYAEIDEQELTDAFNTIK